MVLVVPIESGHVRDGTEVLELVGVDNATHRLDHAVEDFKGKNADDLALGVVGDDPRSAVYEYRFDGYPQSRCLLE